MSTISKPLPVTTTASNYANKWKVSSIEVAI
jgi:hypothetical protein